MLQNDSDGKKEAEAQANRYELYKEPNSSV